MENGEAVYVPRDESFEPIKQTNFTANQLRGLVHKVVPSIRDYFDATPGEFDTLRDIEGLYQEGIEMANAMLAGEESMSRERNRFLDGLPIPDYYRELIWSSTTPTSLLKYPLPRILSKDRFAWMRDDEFARQALAGVNPVVISCLEVSALLGLSKYPSILCYCARRACMNCTVCLHEMHTAFSQVRSRLSWRGS